MQDNKDNNNVNDIDNKNADNSSMKKYVMYVIVQKAGQAR